MADGSGGTVLDLEEDDASAYFFSDRSASRARLRENVAKLLAAIRKPLADVIRDHALVHLPPSALLRLRTVHPSWNRAVCSPLFPSAHARAARSISGFFRSSEGRYGGYLAFLPFDSAVDAIPDGNLSFLPASDTTVCASSHGLACCFSAVMNRFFVCNPVTAEWVALPESPVPSGGDPAVALIYDADAYNFRGDYFVVCAFVPTGDRGDRRRGMDCGVRGFQVFSSVSGKWRVSDALVPAEGLVPESGVAAGGAAWWRTDIGTVVGYSPAVDAARVISCPVAGRWAIGAFGAGAGELCCVCVWEGLVTAYALAADDTWTPAASAAVQEATAMCAAEDNGTVVVPLKCWGANLEAVIWVVDVGQIVAFDMATRRARAIGEALAAPGWDAVYVPHVNTLAPLPPLPIDGEQ